MCIIEAGMQMAPLSWPRPAQTGMAFRHFHFTKGISS
jgi:hypothetical protein